MDNQAFGSMYLVISFLANNLILLMGLGFVIAIIFRLLVYNTVKRQNWFVKEFEKRAFRSLSHLNLDEEVSFFSIAKNTLQKTYHEIFELRRRYGRRHPDQIMTLNDRIFMVQEGTARVILDFLRQARYLEKYQDHPKFLEISKAVFEHNPIFGRLFGYIPINMLNNVLNTLPGLFVIGGIFGTFLGIMEGLPTLGGMDVTDSLASKAVMDNFLSKISFAMNTSIAGILFSVFMTIFNTFLAPENIYYTVINRFTNTIETVWNRCDNNNITSTDSAFVEARDRLDMDAGEALKFDEQFRRDQYLLNNTSFFPEYFSNIGITPDDQENEEKSEEDKKGEAS